MILIPNLIFDIITSQYHSTTLIIIERMQTRALKCLNMVCEELSIVVRTVYEEIHGSVGSVDMMLLDDENANGNKVKKLKADESAFSIADGVVQYIITHDILPRFSVAGIVGEEDITHINLANTPFYVGDMYIPLHIENIIKEVRERINSKLLLAGPLPHLPTSVAFVDPIDGTKEFCEGQGEQCTILIGFSDKDSGLPTAGIVYRPINDTWAAGCESEGYADGKLQLRESMSPKRLFVTSNGPISPFLEQLITKLDAVRYKQGGAGNKILIVLESVNAIYISDRGLSRWDTCAPQAVLAAFGGNAFKLYDFMAHGTIVSYRYFLDPTKEQRLLDFPGVGIVQLTKRNKAAHIELKSESSSTTTIMGATAKLCAQDIDDLILHSNCCGLIAMNARDCHNFLLMDRRRLQSILESCNNVSFD